MSDRPARPAGAVLAGGESRRFGRDKARATLAGRPMAGWAVEALSPHADPLLLVGGDEGLARELGVEAVADRRPGRGPLAGLEAALGRAREAGAPGALVVACDLPLVDGALVGALVAASDGGRRAAVARGPASAGLQPLCAYYPADLLRRVRRLLDGDGPTSMGRFLEGVDARRVSTEEGAGGRPADALMNVNTPADAERAGRILRRRRSVRAGTPGGEGPGGAG